MARGRRKQEIWTDTKGHGIVTEASTLRWKRGAEPTELMSPCCDVKVGITAEKATSGAKIGTTQAWVGVCVGCAKEIVVFNDYDD